MRGLRTAVTAAALAATTLTCAACSTGPSGSDDTPGTSSAPATTHDTATTTASRTATASPSTPPAAGPVVPSAARSHTPAGAVAFVQFYIDQVNRAWTTPQTGLIPALSLPTCKSCAGLESSAKELSTAKAHYARSSLAIEQPEYGVIGNPPRELVTCTIVETPTPTIGPTSTYTPPGKATHYPASLEIAWRDGNWAVTEIRGLK